MFKIIVFLAFALAACRGAPGAGTYCGETPAKIFRCLNSPTVVSHEVSSKCAQHDSECDKMTCVFRESKWLDGAAIDKQKLVAYFDQFVKDHPEWSPAVEYVKVACLRVDLKPQGVYLNCPAYDVASCVFASFIKQATPSQWSTSAECSYPREFAAACPVCPRDCFALQVPIGSCNACFSLPRSP